VRRLRRFLKLLWIAFSKPVIRAWRDSAEKPETFWPASQKIAASPAARGLLEVTGEPPQKQGRKKHRHIGVFGDRG